MSVWTKLNTLFRARIHESAEGVVNQQSLRIFEQEIRDAEQSVHIAKRQLATVMSEKKQLERSQETLATNNQQHCDEAKAALRQGETTLAESLANTIADDENLMQEQAQHIERLGRQEVQLKQQLRDAIHSIQKYRRELNLAKANDCAQSTLQHLRGRTRHLGHSLGELDQTLSDIKARQSRQDDYHEAFNDIENTLSDKPLHDALVSKGIRQQHDAQVVLKRLKGEES